MSKNYITDELGTKGLDKQYKAYFKSLEAIDATINSVKKSCYKERFYKELHCYFIRNLVQRLQNDVWLYKKTDELRDLLVMNWNTTFISERLKYEHIGRISRCHLDIDAAISNAIDDLIQEFHMIF